MKQINWGIIGTGAIASAFAHSIEHCSHSKLSGVYGRNAEALNVFSKKFKVENYELFDLYLSHRYIGDHIDWTGSQNAFVKSVDLVDMSIRKNWYSNIITLNFSNLLNERYEKPATYSQDGRQFSFSFTKSY